MHRTKRRQPFVLWHSRSAQF